MHEKMMRREKHQKEISVWCGLTSHEGKQNWNSMHGGEVDLFGLIPGSSFLMFG